MIRRAVLLLPVPLLLLGATLLRPDAGPGFDLLIRNGLVVDGSGSAAFRADVGISGGRIRRIGDLGGTSSREVIDAAGLVVAPGFLDVHTHADDLAERPGTESYLRMGVTTVVAGNCGSSPVDVGAALARLRQAPPAVNFATLIGHGSVREAVLGNERRAPKPEALARMRELVERAMAAGAAGLSTGLQYVPGSWAEPAEIAELARAACRAGGLYASHLRNEGTAIEAALAEALAVGRAAGCRVQVSHLKIDSPNRWGASGRALALLDEARAKGIDVAADQYVYTAASSGLGIRFPDWALAGSDEEVRRRLDDPPTWERIRAEMRDLLAERGFADLSFAVVAAYEPDPSLQGLSMKEVAARLLNDPSAEGQLEAARRMLRAGGAAMVYHLMSEDDVESILRHPRVAVASDASLPVFGEGRPHPRAYGNTARLLGRYVRERRVVGLEEAVRKLTSLPARHFRFDRGLLHEGAAADLTLFDPRTVRDEATFESPHAYPTGIPWVIVNGTVAIRQGVPTGARAGQVLRPAPP